MEVINLENIEENNSDNYEDDIYHELKTSREVSMFLHLHTQLEGEEIDSAIESWKEINIK